MHTRKIGSTLIKIVSIEPIEIIVNVNKTTCEFQSDDLKAVLSDIKAYLNTSDKHFKLIKSFVEGKIGR